MTDHTSLKQFIGWALALVVIGVALGGAMIALTPTGEVPGESTPTALMPEREIALGTQTLSPEQIAVLSAPEIKQRLQVNSKARTMARRSGDRFTNALLGDEFNALIKRLRELS